MQAKSSIFEELDATLDEEQAALAAESTHDTDTDDDNDDMALASDLDAAIRESESSFTEETRTLDDADAVFAHMDKDGSGHVSFMEFMRWWKESHRAAGEGRIEDGLLAEAKRVFQELDDDDSGSLDREEVRTLLQSLAGQEREMAAAAATAAATAAEETVLYARSTRAAAEETAVVAREEEEARARGAEAARLVRHAEQAQEEDPAKPEATDELEERNFEGGWLKARAPPPRGPRCTYRSVSFTRAE